MITKKEFIENGCLLPINGNYYNDPDTGNWYDQNEWRARNNYMNAAMRLEREVGPPGPNKVPEEFIEEIPHLIECMNKTVEEYQKLIKKYNSQYQDFNRSKQK